MKLRTVYYIFIAILLGNVYIQEVEAGKKTKKILALGLVAAALLPKKKIIALPLPLPIPIKVHGESKQIVPYPVYHHRTKVVAVKHKNGWEDDWHSGWHGGGGINSDWY